MAQIRGAAAFLVIGGLLWLPARPSEHVHRAGIEGRAEAVVHAHALEGPTAPGQADVSLAAGHGDHERAIFLTVVYDATGRTAPPLQAVSAFRVAPPDGPTRIRAAASRHPAHGPPRPLQSPRAPPASL